MAVCDRGVWHVAIASASTGVSAIGSAVGMSHGTSRGVQAFAPEARRCLPPRRLGKGDHYPGEKKDITPTA